jgi:WD40 repeat protein
LAGSSTWSQKKFECVDPHIAQEQDAVTSNGVFTALPWKANSSIAVFPAYGFRRFDNNIHLIKGHTGAITDVAFSPFVDQLLGSASEDGTTKLWVIPEGGITDHVKEWDAELKGHTHKVLGL